MAFTALRSTSSTRTARWSSCTRKARRCREILIDRRPPRSESARPEHLDPEFLLHRAAKAVFHLRPFVIRRRGALIISFRFDAQPDEIGAGRGDDLRHLAVKVGEIV